MSSTRLETTDPDGRLVVIDERSIGHLRRRRAQMLRQLDVILATVERPDIREDDPLPGRERFYRRDLEPGRWLRVVVDFNDVPGFVVTAFIYDHEPGRAT